MPAGETGAWGGAGRGGGVVGMLRSHWALGWGAAARSLAFKVGISTAFPGARPRRRVLPRLRGCAGGTALRRTWTCPLRLGRLYASSKRWLPLPLVPFPICRRSSQSEPQHLPLRPPKPTRPECCRQFLTLTPSGLSAQGLLAARVSLGFANIYSAPVKSCIPGATTDLCRTSLNAPALRGVGHCFSTLAACQMAPGGADSGWCLGPTAGETD